MFVEVPAKVASIAPVVDLVAKLADREMPGSSDKHQEITLALQEAMANAIVHGCKEDAALKVQCWVCCDPGEGLLIGVRDPGKGFDLSSEPQALSQNNLSFDHGRGIHLIRQLMDEVHFERNGAEIHMRKR